MESERSTKQSNNAMGGIKIIIGDAVPTKGVIIVKIDN